MSGASAMRNINTLQSQDNMESPLNTYWVVNWAGNKRNQCEISIRKKERIFMS